MEAKADSMTPEELQAYMDSIPEWKRGALVIVDNEKEAEEVKGLLGKIKGKVGESFNNSKFGKQFYESEEYEKLNKIRKEVKEFKADLQD